MNLREYLFRKEMTIVDFSRLIGRSSGHVRGIIKKRLIPSKTLAQHIERMTDGEVTEEELMENKVVSKT